MIAGFLYAGISSAIEGDTIIKNYSIKIEGALVVNM